MYPYSTVFLSARVALCMYIVETFKRSRPEKWDKSYGDICFMLWSLCKRRFAQSSTMVIKSMQSCMNYSVPRLLAPQTLIPLSLLSVPLFQSFFRQFEERKRNSQTARRSMNILFPACHGKAEGSSPPHVYMYI